MMDENTQFYTYRDGSKTEMCKKCLTMHIDNFDSETYLWLLEKMDVPYVPSEWNNLRDRAFAKNPNLNGMSVFGKYLSKMKLKQFKDFRWADTEKLAAKMEMATMAQREERIQFEEDMKAQLEEGKISEAEYKTMVSTETQNDDYYAGTGPMLHIPGAAADNPYNENNFIDENLLSGPAAQLTEDDKIYLAMKWGRLYQPADWIELERNYNEMMNSFDIQDADTINTLVLLCKTNLKMNQAIDCGDVEGFQKLSKVSESLRKSAKFTAAQNKEQKNDYVDSVGELVAMCERDGFIPRFATDIPQDKVDLTLKDMNSYVHKLVTQDLGFGQQIEDALKKIQIQREMNEAEETAKMMDGETPELIDEDFEEFYSSVEEQKEQDAQGDE
jgi:hypothetical protein